MEKTERSLEHASPQHLPEAARRRAASVDAEALEEALRGRIEGEVRFDEGSRALYSTDGSNYRQVPIGVVIPRTIGDVVGAIEC